MSAVTFLAPVKGTGTVVYGPGHVVTLDGATAETQTRQWQADGKASLVIPDVRQVRVTSLAATTATIAWTVDDPSATTMRVDYGLTNAYGSQQAATPPSGAGAIVANLTGLTTGTLYHYRVVVNSAAGPYNLSPDYTFTTL
jgi:hypothetical protein